ncbi:hypothetical protein [Sinorhizobium numidicum]|uniref:hypothetical protein n=1 Tax=Sinorhizobium numidicum TaxID=680248 RepID=UPI0031451EBC
MDRAPITVGDGHGVRTLRHFERPQKLQRNLYGLVEIGSFRGFAAGDRMCVVRIPDR